MLRSWLSIRRGRVRIHAPDRGAGYPVRVDPFIQKGPKATGSGESAHGELGASIALSSDGKTALIGAPNDGDGHVGAAWVGETVIAPICDNKGLLSDFPDDFNDDLCMMDPWLRHRQAH